MKKKKILIELNAYELDQINGSVFFFFFFFIF